MPRKQVQARSQVRRTCTQQGGNPASDPASTVSAFQHPDDAHPLLQAKPVCRAQQLWRWLWWVSLPRSRQHNSCIQHKKHAAVPCCLRHQRSLVSPTQPAPCAPRVPWLPVTMLCLQCLTRTESHSQPCALAHPHQQVRLTDVAGQPCCQHQASSAGQQCSHLAATLGRCLKPARACAGAACPCGERGLCWACCCCLQEPHSSS